MPMTNPTNEVDSLTRELCEKLKQRNDDRHFDAVWLQF